MNALDGMAFAQKDVFNAMKLDGGDDAKESKLLKQELKKTYRYFYEKSGEEQKEYYKLCFNEILNYEETVKLPLIDLLFYEKVYKECIYDNRKRQKFSVFTFRNFLGKLNPVVISKC